MNGPTARYVVRSTGCGRFLGTILIVVGLLVLWANTGLGISWKYARFWPVLVIALGVYMLVHHYWRLRRPGTEVLPVGQFIPSWAGGRRGMAPPILPVIIIAVGVWRLAENLHRGSTGVVVAIVLVALGALVLSASFRGRLS